MQWGTIIPGEVIRFSMTKFFLSNHSFAVVEAIEFQEPRMLDNDVYWLVLLGKRVTAGCWVLV